MSGRHAGSDEGIYEPYVWVALIGLFAAMGAIGSVVAGVMPGLPKAAVAGAVVTTVVLVLITARAYTMAKKEVRNRRAAQERHLIDDSFLRALGALPDQIAHPPGSTADSIEGFRHTADCLARMLKCHETLQGAIGRLSSGREPAITIELTTLVFSLKRHVISHVSVAPVAVALIEAASEHPTEGPAQEKARRALARLDDGVHLIEEAAEAVVALGQHPQLDAAERIRVKIDELDQEAAGLDEIPAVNAAIGQHSATGHRTR